jgi:rod shape-determining protein MreD
MNPTVLAAQATRWACYLVPLASAFASTLFGVLPLPIPYYGVVAPSLPLIAVYYWMVFRPDLMPTLGLFALGIVQDALAGAPLGVTPLIYLAVQVAIVNQRRFLVGQPFWMLWSGFALLVPPAALFEWSALSLLREAPLPPLATIAGSALTVLLFPLVAYVLVRLQRSLLGMPPGGWIADA